MAGLFCAEPTTSSIQTREYLSCRLTEPLVIGELYLVTFSTYRRNSTNFAVDKLGVYFSSDSIFYDTAEMLPVLPQWESNELLTTSNEWTNYEFFYSASGGEQYLTFGCFRDYNEMQVIDLQTSLTDHNNAYYLFDDFSVERGVGIAATESFIYDVTITESGLNVITDEKGVLILSNSQGQEILRAIIQPGEHRIKLNAQAGGIYFATFFTNQRRRSMRFFWP
jgi:hypothetical protein